MPVPTWMLWTNRGLLAVNGTLGAVLVSQYAGESGQSLDWALVLVIIAGGAWGVLRPTEQVPVTLASILAMLGLALLTPLFLLALVPPLLLTVHRRRARRHTDRGPRP